MWVKVDVDWEELHCDVQGDHVDRVHQGVEVIACHDVFPDEGDQTGLGVLPDGVHVDQEVLHDVRAHDLGVHAYQGVLHEGNVGPGVHDDVEVHDDLGVHDDVAVHADQELHDEGAHSYQEAVPRGVEVVAGLGSPCVEGVHSDQGVEVVSGLGPPCDEGVHSDQGVVPHGVEVVAGLESPCDEVVHSDQGVLENVEVHCGQGVLHAEVVHFGQGVLLDAVQVHVAVLGAFRAEGVH